MPLTPEDVRNKQFTTVRLREGYDEDEVDAFLDEVEAELIRLLRENEECRAQLESVSAGAPVARVKEAPAASVASVPASAQTAAPAAASGQGGERGAATPDAAARLLLLAQRTADEAVSEARTEADKIVTEARNKAEAREREAQARAEALEREARARAEELQRDAQVKHDAAIGTLEEQKQKLEHRIGDLRAFEQEYRSRLKSYLQSQLAELEGRGTGAAPAPAPAG
jgi:DivIVA domain-containing protein